MGTRCRRCAQVQRVPTYQVDPAILLRGLGAGLAVAFVASLVVGAVLRGFSLWLSPVAGLAIGEGMGWATNQKRGRTLQAVAVVAVVAGTVLGNLALLLASGVEPGRALSLMLGGYGLNVFYLVLASVFAVIRLK